MNSIEAIRNYKHDISGKFKDISMAINSLDENSFDDPQAHEIFHAIHEVILKMVKTSKKTIINNTNQEVDLIMTSDEPNIKLPKLQIDGITVRYLAKDSSIRYIYYYAENQGPVEMHIELLKILVPFRNLKFDNIF